MSAAQALERLVDDGAVDPADVVAARLGGLDMVVSSGLPMIPSDGENARRIVRHGFHAAGLLPDVDQPVGPRPFEPTRALLAGRILFVDHELALEIDHRTQVARQRELDEQQQARRWQSVVDRVSAALGLERDQVTAFRRDHMLFETTFRVTGVGTTLDVQVDDDTIARAARDRHDVNGPAIAVAKQIRAALVERRLDDEEAGRGR